MLTMPRTRTTSLALATAIALAALTLAGCRHTSAAGSSSVAAAPAAAVDALLAADRAFAGEAQREELVTVLGRMFDADVFLLAGPELVRGRDAAVAALRRNPRNANARATWTPIRGGVSSDGTQGFTYGYVTVTAADGGELPQKYVAYWRRTPAGWRVAAYKRVPRPAGAPSLALRSPSLPEPGLPLLDDAGMVALEMELRAVEQGFSDLAQRVGLGPAFEANGAPDAVNVGGPADAEFRTGPASIAAGVSAGASPDVTITWSADHVIAARSGDLAVNLGYIVVRQAGQPEARRVPFLTVWRRTPEGWRYVAE
jgi:ketosteroid isomerase-like protein